MNGWLHYRRDCKQLDESVRMDLLEFTTKVATALIMQGKPSGSITPRKRGRPSAANTSQLVENEPEKKVLRTRQFSPIEEVAKDGFAHWPEMVMVSSRKRCKKVPSDHTDSLYEMCHPLVSATRTELFCGVSPVDFVNFRSLTYYLVLNKKLASNHH